MSAKVIPLCRGQYSRQVRTNIDTALEIAGPDDTVEMNGEFVTVTFAQPETNFILPELVKEDVPPRHVVYFIEAVGIGIVKIGKTACIENRMGSLKTMSPVPLRLVAYAPGYSRLERQLHDLFRAHRSHGEWFKAAPDIVRCANHLRREYGLLAVEDFFPVGKPWEGK